MKNPISWQTKTGDAIEIDDVSVIPQAQVVRIRLPFGGFIWNRPTRVMVEYNGRITTFPLLDVTRMLLWGIVGLTAVVLFVIFVRRDR